MSGWIDTHCHLQAQSLQKDLDGLIESAKKNGLIQAIICAGSPDDWTLVQKIARRYELGYALGIHPLYIENLGDEALVALETLLVGALNDPFLVAIGEIGIDGLVRSETMERQEFFFSQQLKIARRLGLPVSIHCRQSADRLLKYLRRTPVGGVVHAFNGSDVQRNAFLQLGLKLGIGGAATYSGSLRIRRHVAEMPQDAWVLETDAPDMPSSMRRDLGSVRTEPSDILWVAQSVAQLRKVSLEYVQKNALSNTLAAFPRLQTLLNQG